MVSELFYTSEQLVSPQKQDTGKKNRVSHTKIQRNGSSNRAKSYGGGIPPYKR